MMMLCPRLSPFLKKIYETVLRLGMWEPGDKILLAVSGGADSISLLYSLVEFQDVHGAELGVVHLNHGLRPEADEEESFVRNNAQSLGLPFFTKKVSLRTDCPGLSIEEAGRAARYAFFRETLKREGFDFIATAHHADDQAEQILMNLVRGCGPDGLCGIPAMHGDILRPLIRLQKKELQSYLTEKNLPWREDKSNSDILFLRNRIRHELFPLLEASFNPAVKKNLLQLGAIAAEDKFFWEDLVEVKWQELLIEKKDHSLRLSMKKLKNLMPALQSRLLRHAIREIKGNLLGVGKKHMEAIRNLLMQTESRTLHLPDRIRLNFSRGILEIQKSSHPLRVKNNLLHEFEKHIPLPFSFPHEIFLPEGLGKLHLDLDGETIEKTNTVFIPADSFPLSVRNFRAGDRIRPHGHTGFRKVLPFLSEKGIPFRERSKRPILVRKNEVLWVPGLPPSFKTGENPVGGQRIRILWVQEKELEHFENVEKFDGFP